MHFCYLQDVLILKATAQVTMPDLIKQHYETFALVMS